MESLISNESCPLTATLIQLTHNVTRQCAKTFSVAHCSCNQDTDEHLEHIRFSVHENIMTKLCDNYSSGLVPYLKGIVTLLGNFIKR